MLAVHAIDPRPELMPRSCSDVSDPESIAWLRCDTVLWRAVFDDVVVALPDGDLEPFVLAGGAALWERLQMPCTISDLRMHLPEETNSEGSQVETLISLLMDLEERGLVSRVGAFGAIGQRKDVDHA